MTTVFREFLCVDTLISDIYSYFQKIPDPRNLSDRVSISFTRETALERGCRGQVLEPDRVADRVAWT